MEPKSFPYLSFLPPDFSDPGMDVYEIELNPSDIPLAPFKSSRFTVEPGRTSQRDTHSVREMWMVAQGSGELFYDGQSYRLEPGNVVYFDPPKTHQLKNDGTETFMAFSIWWKA